MKKILALLLAVLMLVPMASCGAAPKQPSFSPTDSEIIATDELTDIAFAIRQGVSAYAEDSAYIRGGSHSDKNFAEEVKSSEQLILKTINNAGDYDRNILLKFDISKMKLEDMQSVFIYLQASHTGTAEMTAASVGLSASDTAAPSMVRYFVSPPTSVLM